MTTLRDRFLEFFRRPYGVGSPLNIHMFSPGRLVRHVQTAVADPRYFVDRVRVIGYQFVHPSEPWLTQDALRAIKGFVRADMRAFEFGSGRSTLWLAGRVAELISVEHDPAWHTHVDTMLREAAVRNTDLRLADESTYAAQISRFPDRYFDFVLIDGADRNGCIRAAAQKVRAGGWIVVDNADSPLDLSPLDGYRRTETRNGVWQTDIFVRTAS